MKVVKTVNITVSAPAVPEWLEWLWLLGPFLVGTVALASQKLSS